jgi:hypothetical protein
MTQNFYLVTIICPETASGHLVDNIRKFKPVSYTVESISSAKGDAEAAPCRKVQVICTRNDYKKVMDYINQYYVKDYGVILYMNEVFMPM